MTESAAVVANDLIAWAGHFARSDKDAERVFRESARVIRAIADGQRVDGRTWGGLELRQRNFLSAGARLGEQACSSLERGRRVMFRLLKEGAA